MQPPHARLMSPHGALSPLSRDRAFALWSLLLGLLCAGALACRPASAPSRAPQPTPLERLADSLGGRSALLSLTGIHYAAEGQRWALLQGLTDAHRVAVSHYRNEVSADLEGRCLVETARQVEYVGRREKHRYTQRLSPVGGTLEGDEGRWRGSKAASTKLSSARVAASLRELELLMPHGPIRNALVHAGPAHDAGQREGGRFQLYGLGAFQFWVDTDSGHLARVRVLESFAPYQDVWVEARFDGWERLEGSPALWPRAVSLRVAGREVLVEKRLGTARQPTRAELGALEFELPARSRHNEPEACRGREQHFSLLMAQSMGRPVRDRLQLKVDARELSEGVWHLTGGSHHSLVVEQSAGLVLIEAPLDRQRTHSLYDWAAELWPGRPISHVVATHHHDDSSGGVREAVGRSARLVAHRAAEAFWQRVLAAPSTLEPDSLDAAGSPGRIDWVGERLTLPDADRPVTAYSVGPNCHAADLLVVEVGDWLYVSDLASPGLSAPLCPLRPLLARLRRRGLEAQRAVGAHGGTAPLRKLLAR